MARALTGVGAAMILAPPSRFSAWCSHQTRGGKAIGINVTAMFIGFTLGLLAGGFLSYYINWRGIFLIVAIVAAVDLTIVLMRMKGEYNWFGPRVTTWSEWPSTVVG